MGKNYLGFLVKKTANPNRPTILYMALPLKPFWKN
jgi:hypothetical protein